MDEVSPDEEAWLGEYFTIAKPNAFFIKRAGGGATTWCLYNRWSRSFPAGLFDRAVVAAEAAGFKVTVCGRRPRPCAPQPVATWTAPQLFERARPEQVEALRAVARRGQGLLKMPTGAGKTFVFVLVTQALPCRWLFIVGDLTLVNQAADELEKLTGEVAGRIGDQKWSESRVTFSTWQTLWPAFQAGDQRAIDLVESVGGVCIDECHGAATDSVLSLLLRTKAAYYRIGLSATPLDRNDGKNTMIVGGLGPVIYEAAVEDLIASGVLARGRATMVPFQHPERPEGYPCLDTNTAILNKDRCIVLADIATKRAAKPCLLFVEQLSHGQALLKLLRKRGVSCDFVHGEDNTFRRNNALRWLKQGKLDVLVCSRIFRQGVDVPSLASVVVGNGDASVVATTQRAGRGARSDGGRKETFEIWDIDDRDHSILQARAKRRAGTYRKAGHDVVIERTDDD